MTITDDAETGKEEMLPIPGHDHRLPALNAKLQNEIESQIENSSDSDKND